MARSSHVDSGELKKNWFPGERVRITSSFDSVVCHAWGRESLARPAWFHGVGNGIIIATSNDGYFLVLFDGETWPVCISWGFLKQEKRIEE